MLVKTLKIKKNPISKIETNNASNAQTVEKPKPISIINNANPVQGTKASPNK